MPWFLSFLVEVRGQLAWSSLCILEILKMELTFSSGLGQAGVLALYDTSPTTSSL